VNCRACNQTKSETEFTKCGQGRRSICRECDNAARRQRDFGISGEEFELLKWANGGLCWCCGKRPAAVLDHEHARANPNTRFSHGLPTPAFFVIALRIHDLMEENRPFEANCFVLWMLRAL
jgi:hypothetical protein